MLSPLHTNQIDCRPGYRSVQLMNSFDHPLELATILVHFHMAPAPASDIFNRQGQFCSPCIPSVSGLSFSTLLFLFYHRTSHISHHAVSLGKSSKRKVGSVAEHPVGAADM